LAITDDSLGELTIGDADLSTMTQDSHVYTIANDDLSADFDDSLLVNGADFLRWQRGFGIVGGATFADGDSDLDGNVDLDDLTTWEVQFGTILSGPIGSSREEAPVLLVDSGLLTPFIPRSLPSPVRLRRTDSMAVDSAIEALEHSRYLATKDRILEGLFVATRALESRSDQIPSDIVFSREDALGGAIISEFRKADRPNLGRQS